MTLGDTRVTTATKSSFRADIQGLRAVAVVAVVLDHLLHWPTGGFVGVDIFFVISGFLITGLLIREWGRTGKISFIDFYRRRIKRILPAALLVIIVTVGVAGLLFAKQRFKTTLWDAFFSTVFSANWRFLAVGSDYFQADGPISPFRHYWSLAVEEQFYFVWPWLMLGILLLTRKVLRRPHGSMRVAAGAIAALSAASFAWALFETSTNAGAAYYDTFTRVWELGIGALLAFAVPQLRRIPDALRPWIANLGLLGIVVSLFVVTPSGGFPAPSGLLPVLSAAAVIGAGCGGEQRYLAPLTNRVSQYVGDISFSLYLWHFPVVVFLGTLIDPDWFYYTVAGLMMLALSAYSFRLVEDPIRKSAWLSRSAKPPRPERRRGRLHVLRPIAGLVVSVVVLGGAVGAKVASTPAVTVPANAVGASATGPAFPVDGPEVAKIQAELADSVKATSWPDFQPSLEDIMAKDPYPDGVHECGFAGPHPANQCTWGPPDAKKHAVLVGDSISMRWATPLTKLYAQNGWNIRVMGLYGCPFNLYPITKAPDSAKQCDDRKAEDIQTIQDLKPDIVFIGNTQVPEQMSTTGAPATPADWGAGMDKILSKIPNAKHKVILSPPPFGKDPRECYNPVKGPQACVGEVSQLWFDVSAADRKAVEAVEGGVYIDTRALYCTPQGLCPEMAAGIPIKQDYTHMTMYYGEHIQNALAEMLKKRGLS